MCLIVLLFFRIFEVGLAPVDFVGANEFQQDVPFLRSNWIENELLMDESSEDFSVSS